MLLKGSRSRPTLLAALHALGTSLHGWIGGAHCRVKGGDLVRLLLAVTVLWTVRAPRPLVVLDPPQQVTSSNPKAGVHTRLTDEVETWKIQRTLRMVRQMGTPWIVEYFPWPYIEPEEGAYSWHHSDTVIDHARNQGLTVIARLGWVPKWARSHRENRTSEAGQPETTLTYLDPTGYDAFAGYVAAFAERYQGQVDHLVIWNEPNLSFEWGYRTVDPGAYVDLLRAVYPRAHAANRRDE